MEMFLSSGRSRVKTNTAGQRSSLQMPALANQNSHNHSKSNIPGGWWGQGGTHTSGRKARNNNAVVKKMKWNFLLHAWRRNLAQQHCARAALTGNISKDLPQSKKWIKDGQQKTLLMISSCSGKDEHPLENRAPIVLWILSRKCQIKPKGINAKWCTRRKLSQLIWTAKASGLTTTSQESIRVMADHAKRKPQLRKANPASGITGDQSREWSWTFAHLCRCTTA